MHTRLFLDLVQDAMNEYSYNADLAGLSYKLETQANGILINIDGYNDKLPVLAKVVLEKMAKLQVDPQRFEIIKDQIRRNYQNFKLAAPSGHTTYWVSYLTQNKVYTPEEKLDVLEGMSDYALSIIALTLDYRRLRYNTTDSRRVHSEIVAEYLRRRFGAW